MNIPKHNPSMQRDSGKHGLGMTDQLQPVQQYNSTATHNAFPDYMMYGYQGGLDSQQSAISQSNNMHMNPGVNPNSDLFVRNENLGQQYREGTDSIITPKSANMNVKCVPDMMSMGMGVGGHGHSINTKDNYRIAQDAIMHLNNEPNQTLNECDGMPLNANTNIQHSSKHSMNHLGSGDQ